MYIFFHLDYLRYIKLITIFKVLVISTYIFNIVQLKASLYIYVTKIEFRETNFHDGSNFNNFRES